MAYLHDKNISQCHLDCKLELVGAINISDDDLVFQKSIIEFFIDTFLLSKSTPHPAFCGKYFISETPIPKVKCIT